MTETKRDNAAVLAGKRVAIVHDFLLYPGGAEKVLGEMLDLFPHAPVFTLLYDAEHMKPMAQMLEGRRIHTSFLQKCPRWFRTHTKWLVPLMPTAPEMFDLRDYDVVISSSSAWSKGIVTRVSSAHVAYIHSPMRFVWDDNISYVKQRAKKKPGLLMRWLLSYLRVWDFEAAQRPDVLVANSRYTQERIAKFYRRDTAVAYPPIDVPNLDAQKQKRKDYFLVVGRLSEYKNVELAVDVCSRLELPLVVVGAGRMYDDLVARAGKTVQVLGWQSDAQLTQHYRRARALLMPGEEDFGLVMAEALAHNLPVIAYGRGGACEMVEPGVTGELFFAQTHEVMADGIRRFLEHEKVSSYDVAAMRARVSAFNREAFRAQLEQSALEAIAHAHIQTK